MVLVVVLSLLGLDEKSGEMGLISLLFTSTTLTGDFGELSSCFELDKDDEDEAKAADDVEFVVFFCFFCFDTLLIDSVPRDSRRLQDELFFDPLSFFPPGISSSLFVVTKVGPSLLLLGDTVDAAAVTLLSLLLPLSKFSLLLFVVFRICCFVLDIQLNCALLFDVGARFLFYVYLFLKPSRILFF